MEDSGIDSGDHNGDVRDQQHKNVEVIFIRTANSDTSSSADSGGISPARTYISPLSKIISPLPPPPPQPPPTSRQLHRKLEARIESARRLHQRQQQLADGSGITKHGGRKGGPLATIDCVTASGGSGGCSTGPGLLPMQRLNIPRTIGCTTQPSLVVDGCKHQQLRPLVQWEDSDDSEEDIINFFPLSRKESKSHQEISDTFSIEELSISGDEDEEDDLHLVPPSTIYRTVTCCPAFSCTLL